MRKHHIVLTAEERKKLKKLAKRKLISLNAKKQISILLMFDNGEAIITVAELFAVSHQTIYKWIRLFKESRMASLLVYTEKKTNEEEDNKIEEEEE